MRILHLHEFKLFILFDPTSSKEMYSLQTLYTSSQHVSANIWSCSVIVSCSLSHYICILLTLVSAYSPSLLTPLPQSIPCKSLPLAAIPANTIPPALPCSSKAQETAAYTAAGLQGEWEGGGGREGGEWDWMGKREMEDRQGGILWEGSQSNYRQRCSPGFFGGTKFTFQRSLPPSPSTFLLLLSMLLPATLFLIFSRYSSHSHPLTVHPRAPHPSLSPSVCLSWLHERGGGITGKASNLVPL